MIAKGSSDEDLARKHIARLQGLIVHWNEDADTYRRVARGLLSATTWMRDEADRTRIRIRDEAALCDTLVENLPPGHELWSELFRIETALDALSESIAVSAEAMGPRIEQSREVAGLRYLVSELRKNSAAQTVPG